MAATAQGRGLAALRFLLGVFFVFESVIKAGWILDPAPLVNELTGWLATAGPLNRWYLVAVCLPWAPVFARLVMLGELSTGLAFIFGAYTRLAACLSLLMVLNIHVASGALFTYQFLTNGYGLPVIGGLLALLIGGGSLPASLKKT